MRKICFGHSEIHGYGIFTARDIKKGEIIFIAKGRKMNLNLKTKEEAMSNPDMIGVGKNMWLDPSLLWGAYINHSCNPSAGIKGSVTFIALRDIKKGEEVTFDYSISEDTLWEMPCNCGAKNCRGVIRGIQYLPEKIFQKYMPFIPKYFQKVYIKNNKNKNKNNE